MASKRTPKPRVTDEDVRKSGRAAVTRIPDGERILQIRRGGFSDEPAHRLPKDRTNITSKVLLAKTGANGGGAFRITRRSGKDLEYYVDGTGMLHVPTEDLDVSTTDEVVDLAKRLVALHGDPKRLNYTRNGVSVREVANNLWEHALVAQKKHANPILNAIGGSRADLADIDSGDWKMAISELTNVTLDGNRRLDAVRRQEEIRRRQAAGLDASLLYNMESEEGVVDQETGDFIDLDYEPETRQDSKGGDAGEGSETPVPESEAPVQQGGPRIVINPSVFRDDKDALCVAFNEAFRIVMEEMEFNPVAEPTEKQRKFFADTAYSQDENQMRRTILARIATFDTSVSDPTNEQLQETVEFLHAVLQVGAPQNDFEQRAVQQIIDVLSRVESDGVRTDGGTPEAPEPLGVSVQADEGGGEVQQTDDDEARRAAEQAMQQQQQQQQQQDAPDSSTADQNTSSQNSNDPSAGDELANGMDAGAAFGNSPENAPPETVKSGWANDYRKENGIADSVGLFSWSQDRTESTAGTSTAGTSTKPPKISEEKQRRRDARAARSAIQSYMQRRSNAGVLTDKERKEMRGKIKDLSQILSDGGRIPQNNASGAGTRTTVTASTAAPDVFTLDKMKILKERNRKT